MRTIGPLAMMVVLVCWSATDLSAQGNDPRAYQGVFGAAGRETTAKQSLDLSVALQQGFDDGGSPDGGDGTPTSLESGLNTALDVESRFAWRARRVQIGASAGTGLRYYTETSRFTVASHSAGLGLSARLGRSANLFVNQSFTYTPAFLQGLSANIDGPVAGAVTSAPASFVVDSARAYAYATTANVTRSIGRRGSIAVVSALRITDVTQTSAAPRSLTAYDVGGSYKHGLTRNVGLVLGYTYKMAEYADGNTPIEHQIDAGLDYHRSMSLSRRTTFTAAFGSAVVSGRVSADPGATASESTNAGQSKREFQLRANAQLAHQLGRTWHVRAVYRREISYVEELGTPVLTNGVTTAVDGFANRRVDVSATASYTDGSSALTGASGFKTYTGTLRMRTAIARSWAVSADYLYYFHDFKRTADILDGVPSRLGHHTLRAGLTFWIPVRRK